MKSYLKKNNNWLYVSAILLYILGILLSTIFDKNVSMEDNPIMGIITQLNGWLILLTIVVIAPVIEELSFRSWAVNKNWIKYLSLILSSAFMFLLNPYIGIVYFLIFLGQIIFLKNKTEILLISLAITTSIGFVLAHSGNLEREIFLITIPIYLGGGLLLSYIALRYKLRYSMIAHALYNFSLLLLGGFIIPFGNSIILNEGNYEGSLKPVSGLYSKKGTDNYGGYSANISKTMLPEIISMLEFDSDYKIKTYPKGYSFYNLEVKTKDTLNKIDLKALSQEIIKKANLRLDTIIVLKDAFFVEIRDVEEIKREVKEKMKVDEFPESLSGIINNISYYYNETIIIPKEYNNLMVEYKKEFSTLSSDKRFEDIRKDLEKEYGIILKPKKAQVKVIRIFEEIK